PVARQLVQGHLHELGEHHFSEIARRLSTTVATVKQAWHFIRANLNPYPAHAFAPSDLPDQGLASSGEGSVLVRPDVIIRCAEHSFEAEVVERRRFRFGLNAMYCALYRQCRANASERGVLSDPERQHVREYATRARFFMECVRQRWETL